MRPLSIFLFLLLFLFPVQSLSYETTDFYIYYFSQLFFSLCFAVCFFFVAFSVSFFSFDCAFIAGAFFVLAVALALSYSFVSRDNSFRFLVSESSAAFSSFISSFSCLFLYCSSIFCLANSLFCSDSICSIFTLVVINCFLILSASCSLIILAFLAS